MTEPTAPIPIEDLPDPDLSDLQGRDIPYPAVRVQHNGAILTRAVPNQVGVVEANVLNADGTGTKMLNADPRRARAVIVCVSQTLTTATHILVARSKTGAYAPWPPNVALVVTHRDELWAKLNAAGAGTVTVISESYAD